MRGRKRRWRGGRSGCGLKKKGWEEQQNYSDGGGGRGGGGAGEGTGREGKGRNSETEAETKLTGPGNSMGQIALSDASAAVMYV